MLNIHSFHKIQIWVLWMFSVVVLCGLEGSFALGKDDLAKNTLEKHAQGLKTPSSKHIVDGFLSQFNKVQNFHIYFIQIPLILQAKHYVSLKQQSVKGQFWLYKPGRLRLAYNNKKLPLLILNSNDMTVVQRDIQSIYYLPAKRNIWAFLLKRHIMLPKDATSIGTMIHHLILQKSQNTDYYHIAFSWHHQQVVFITDMEYHIKQILYTNATGQILLLNIQHILLNQSMNLQNLFYFVTPSTWKTLNAKNH